MQYPTIPYHFDLSGLWTPSHKQRNLYGRLNKRAYPDLFIAAPSAQEYEFLVDARRMMRPYSGLFLELKRDGTVLHKKDGSLRANPHHIEQATVLQSLEQQGFMAVFAVGYEQATRIIDEYLYKPATRTEDLQF